MVYNLLIRKFDITLLVCTRSVYLFVHTPYDSSTNAKDKLRIRNINMFLEVFSDNINLKVNV